MGCASSNKVGASKQPFNAVYKLDNTVLGKGGFGVVSLGKRISDDAVVAVKIVTRAGERTVGAEKALLQEWSVMKSLVHPGIIRAYDLFIEDRFCSLAVEYIAGGDLFERVVEKESYTELDARDLTKNLLLALKYLHDRNIVHRDIKPDNVLLMDNKDNTSLKLADFGLAAKLNKPGDMLTGGGGTVGYAAPELIKRVEHSKPVDMWAVGCLVFVLISGTHPFDFGEDEKTVNAKVMRNVWSFNGDLWKEASSDSKDLVKKMLIMDQKERMTVDQALAHSWIKSGGDELKAKNMSKTLVELKAFRARRNFKKGVRAIMVSNMIQGLRAGAGSSRSSSARSDVDSSSSSSRNSSIRSDAGGSSLRDAPLVPSPSLSGQHSSAVSPAPSPSKADMTTPAAPTTSATPSGTLSHNSVAPAPLTEGDQETTATKM